MKPANFKYWPQKEDATCLTVLWYQLAEVGDTQVVQSISPSLLAEPSAVPAAVPGACSIRPETVPNYALLGHLPVQSH